jgi:rubredoxin
LGTNDTINYSSPVQTVSGDNNWKQASAGGYFTAAIKTDGTLWTWGMNNYGELGTNNTTYQSSPVQTVAGGTNWKYVSVGTNFTAATKTDGTLWLWGRNAFGGLGTGNTTSRSSPVQTISAGTDWKQISAGHLNMAAIKNDGTLWNWGYNADGNLGDNTVVPKSSPVQTISGGNNWKQVFCSGNWTGAIKTDGTLWTWGGNNYGVLGDNTIVKKSSPVQTIAGGTNWKQVGGTYWMAAAIKTDGSLWTWGGNNYGALGDNTVVPKSSPIQTVAGGTSWQYVSLGGQRNCGAITTVN